jgi:sulfite reductase (ferredoxin)
MPLVEIDPEFARQAQADITKFENMLDLYLGGQMEEDPFRVFRLNNGIYGQRQGGTNQMVRVKSPWGGVTPDQLELFARVADEYSRGWGHITTRQNVQFHFVELKRVPELLKEMAAVGLTSREACGDTVRNVQGCHLAGACPFEAFDITPWAEAAFRHFLHNPIAQRLPRKFKINFSGCDTDCGQAMFNDVGVIAATRTNEDGEIEQGFRVYIAGGLGANPHPALALEPFTAKEDLLPTIESVLRVFEQTGNRKNKLRARLKWVIDDLGFEEVQQRIFAVRRFLPGSSSWPGGIPDVVREWGDAPAGMGANPTPMGQGTSVTLSSKKPYERWEQANVVRGNAKGTVSAYAWSRLGDVTASQFRGLAAVQRELGASVRVTNRQNFAFRDLTEEQLPILFSRLTDIGMAEPGAELSRDVVACPGADTCNLAVTQSRGLAVAISDALEGAGLAEVGGIRTNISGCTNSCGQHHIADIGFHGVERRANGRPAPGYQLLLGGHVGDTEIEFGHRALRLPAKAAAEATVRLVGRYADERAIGEPFAGWMDRVGGAKALGTELKDLDVWPDPDERPDYYIDFDETGPYVADVGEGECAAS